MHVLPHSTKGWAIQTEGASRPMRLFTKQAQAEVFGRRIAKKRKAELFVHSHTGKIELRDSYGNDPFPPRG